MTMETAARQSNDRDRDIWRIFAAAPVNHAVRQQMQAIQNAMVAHNWPVRWVDPKLAHITLKFYGDTEPGDRARLERGLASVAGRFQPAMLQTAGLGAFPSATRARVLWLGLAGEVQQLAALAQAVEAITDNGSARREKRSFKAHITLARVRDGAKLPADLQDVLSAVSLDPVDLNLDRLQLIRSVLGPKGPTYTTIGEWQLGGAPTETSIISPEVREHG